MSQFAAFTTNLLTPDRLLIDARHVRVEKRTLPTGHLSRGAIVGRVAGDATSEAWAGNVGDGTLGPITVGGAVKIGQYRLLCVTAAEGAGVFHLEDPFGHLVGVVNVGSAFSGPLSFTLAAGSQDFAANDLFLIEVADSGSVALIGTAAPAGARVAWGILATGHDATEAPQEVLVYTGGGTFNRDAAAIGAGASLSVAEHELKQRGITLRGAMPT